MLRPYTPWAPRNDKNARAPEGWEFLHYWGLLRHSFAVPRHGY